MYACISERKIMRTEDRVMLSSYGVCRTSTDEVEMCNSRDSGEESKTPGSEKVRQTRNVA